MKKTRGGGADAERRRSSTRLKVRAQTGRFGDVKGRRSCFNLSPPRACVIFITRTSCSLWLLHVAARLGRVDDVSQSVLSTPVVVVVDWPCADHSSHLFSVCTRRQLGDNPRPSNQWTCERSQSHSDSEKVVRLNWHASVGVSSLVPLAHFMSILSTTKPSLLAYLQRYSVSCLNYVSKKVYLEKI